MFGNAVRYAEPGGLARELLGVLESTPMTDDETRTSAGRALVARHTWRAAAERHLELYRRLIAAGAPVGTRQVRGGAEPST